MVAILDEHEIISSSPEETQQVASKLLREIDTNHVIALFGDLGAGKTTFSQGIGKALGVKRHLQSPTFTIIKVYDVSGHKRFKTLQHIDLYRLETQSEIQAIGITELLSDEESLILIEWSEKMKESLPEKRIEVHLEYVDEEKRKILVKKLT